jgi:hypothetical protein
VPIHCPLGINIVATGTLSNVRKQVPHTIGERIKMPKRARVNWANLKFSQNLNLSLSQIHPYAQ